MTGGRKGVDRAGMEGAVVNLRRESDEEVQKETNRFVYALVTWE